MKTTKKTTKKTRAAKTKTTKTNVAQARRMQQDVSNGQQDLLYKAIWLLGDHRLRVRRRRNAYTFQSHALIERWDGAKWHTVESIPYERMNCGQGDSYVSRSPRPNASELADEAELLRRACLVLGYDAYTQA